ncbi:MAG: ferritin family protein [Candidatus Aminicenantales bacterium]
MELTSFHDIIDFAIKREEEAFLTYGRMRKMAQTPGLEKLLAELQQEEKKHRELLQDITREKIGSLEIQEVTDLKISDYLVEEPSGAEMNFQDLLILAAKKEQKAADLYSDLGKKAKREEIKKLFDFLVQQEKAHKLRLEEEYDKQVLEED